MITIPYARCLSLSALLALGACSSSDDTPEPPPPAPVQAPNILLVIMDDVGIDQMSSFGYGGATPPRLPNIDAVANAGIRFRNAWGMPECSPTRAGLVTGRYPLRTGVYPALGPLDLANSQVSPYETTLPTLLKQAGYQNGLFGKFHLAGPENNPAGNFTPAVLGWDYFYGWVAGVPASIDSTAGGIAEHGTYACGFVPSAAAGGADTGACYFADNSCQPMRSQGPNVNAPGLQCLDAGGIFVPEQTCGTPPATLDFQRQNAYYVSPLVIIDQGQLEEVPLTDPRARRYRTRLETDAAIDWIRERAGSDTPWMATVSYTAAHTPIQQPPAGLLPSAQAIATDSLSCDNPLDSRVLQNRMTEALDHEFGRLLVETGLATQAADGSLIYDPAASNTVIVVLGDNGTLGLSVKAPFNPSRAKGSSYQTGVWIPLLVAGPQVNDPDRDVEHMVNAVDLFHLFAELAGIDAQQAVPRTIDAVPMLPYLTDPAQPSVRSVNFTTAGYGQQANGTRNGPCVINGSCTQVPFNQGVCEDNLGTWWGPGYRESSGVVDNGGAGYLSCCAVNQALYLDDQPMIAIQPEESAAIRNDTFKLVQNQIQTYDPTSNTCGVVVSSEFYRVNQATPVPLLDDPDKELPLANLSPEERTAYNTLSAQMAQLLASEPECPGDGNLDGVVNEEDVANWRKLAMEWGLSSVYDMKIDGLRDGLTNNLDGQIIQQNLGLRCARVPSVS